MQDTVIIILFVWNAVLTVAFLLTFMHNKLPFIYNKRSRNSLGISSDEDLKAVISSIQRELSAQDKKSSKYIQKVGFLKFNPFLETGGAQSFAVAVLDRNDDGFVLTSLHTRSGTRTYAKLIKQGKSPTELSKEEEKALQLAQHEETE